MQRSIRTILRVALAGAALLFVANDGTAQVASPANGAERLRTLAQRTLPLLDGEQKLAGLKRRVTVVRDQWGIAHIYADNTDDLFFAQGFIAAQDRLWQMEMWRRAKEGRLAEVLGPRALERDRVARLLRYRGPYDDTEWTSYHPEGKRIMTAFAAGVNAFIGLGEREWPVEFQLTGIRPDRWTAETPLLREITFGDASAELRLARDVAAMGALEANRRRAPEPWDALAVPKGLDVAAIDAAVIASTGTGGAMPRPALLPE